MEEYTSKLHNYRIGEPNTDAIPLDSFHPV